VSAVGWSGSHWEKGEFVKWWAGCNNFVSS